jgi:hypothetical protein
VALIRVVDDAADYAEEPADELGKH